MAAEAVAAAAEVGAPAVTRSNQGVFSMKLRATAFFFSKCACGAVFYKTLFHRVKKRPLIVLATLIVLNTFLLSACAGQPTRPPSGSSEMPTESTGITMPSTSPSAETTALKMTESTDITAPSTLESNAISTSPPFPSPEELANAFIDPFIDEAIALIDADRRQLSRISFDYQPKLLYDDLREEEKALYDEMLKNTQSLKPFSYTAAQHGYEGMDMAMNVCIAVKCDHPEIENYYILREVIEDGTTTAVEALYFMPWDAELQPANSAMLSEEIRRFDAVCTRIVDCMPDDFSTYDKYRYLASVISLVTSYDYDGVGGWQLGTAYGSIMSGRSICQGYSRGFLYLCQKADLWCETVVGTAGENVGHMWNMVKLDSGTYFVDITWCDEAGLPGSAEWHNYFMLTQDDILFDHTITDGKVATGKAIN